MVVIQLQFLPKMNRLISSWKTEKLSIFWFASTAFKNLVHCLCLLLPWTFIYMKNNERQCSLLFSCLFCFQGFSSFRNGSGSLKPQDLKMGGILDNFDAAPVQLICVLSPSLPASSWSLLMYPVYYFLFQREVRRWFGLEQFYRSFRASKNFSTFAAAP